MCNQFLRLVGGFFSSFFLLVCVCVCVPELQIIAFPAGYVTDKETFYITTRLGKLSWEISFQHHHYGCYEY